MIAASDSLIESRIRHGIDHFACDPVDVGLARFPDWSSVSEGRRRCADAEVVCVRPEE